MRIEDLRKDFKKITGDDVSPQTLRRWADDRLITNHRDNRANIKEMTTGRGHPEDWPPQALWEAAAVWAVNKVKRLPSKTIRDIRTVAQQVFRTPEAKYEWSRDVVLSGPTPTHIESKSYPRGQYGYRVLKMKFQDDVLDLFSWLCALREGAQPMPGDERLIKLLDDEKVVSALDRYIEHRDPDDYFTVLYAISRVLISYWKKNELSPLAFNRLARTWVAAFVKAQKGKSLSQPKKVVFHWRSLEDPGWFPELYMITLEEPDPLVSVLADFEDYAGTPEGRGPEDEIVIFIDGIDVREKVFYAPFAEFEEWRSLQREP
jgi:hypothetical protein